MKIGVFAYNFKHWKTQQGLYNLCMAGYKPSVILAADPVELSFYRSKIRVGPRDRFLWHPKKIAEHFDIDYHVVVHNSSETNTIVKRYNLDVGVILGARILKPIAFENFNIGVINMHPGVLPENRGLDNLKWAIMKGYDQGVTTHLIDSKIDRGLLIEKNTITIYNDDTLIDLQLRIQELEQKMMISALDKIGVTNKANLVSLAKGNYHKSLPPELESSLMEKFEQYRSKKCRQ